MTAQAIWRIVLLRTYQIRTDPAASFMPNDEKSSQRVTIHSMRVFQLR